MPPILRALSSRLQRLMTPLPPVVVPEVEVQADVRAIQVMRAKRRTGKRVYAGAEVSRLTQDWITSILSADQEIKGDLMRLRGASRSLVRDNSYAARFVTMLGENVIGHTGLQLKGMIRTTRDQPNTALNNKLEWAWYNWQWPEAADVCGEMSWVDICLLLVRTLATDGELLLRHVPAADNEFGYAVQVLDPDLLDVNFSVEGRGNPAKTGNEVRMGVELEPRYGKPVAYWLWTQHPNEAGPIKNRRERVRVPASEIVHKFVKLRPGQTRGVPWFAPVLLDQKMLQGYQEAEITAARIAASNMAAIETDPEVAGGFAAPAAGESQIPHEVEPGLFLRLNPGETLSSTEFNHPASAFGPFTKVILRSLATGLNVAYTSLTGDLEAVNYSSIRAGLLSERDFYRRMQTWFSCYVARPVYREWVKYAALTGHIPAREAESYDRVAWKARGWAWVDPMNDVQAAQLAIQEGFTTRTQVCAERGEDFEDNLEQLAAEKALMAQYGVELGAPKPEATGEPGAEDDASKKPADESDDTDTEDPDSGRALPVRLIRGR